MATRGKSKDTQRAANAGIDETAAPSATPESAPDMPAAESAPAAHAPETRPLPVVDAQGASSAASTDTLADAQDEAPQDFSPNDGAALYADDDAYTNPAPLFDGEDDGDATVIRQVMPSDGSPSRPKWNTLASAISRPVASHERPSASTPGGDTPQPQQHAQPTQTEPTNPPAADGIADEIDEWSVADQPTVQMTPQMLQTARPPQRPTYPDTGEQATPPAWPPRPAAPRNVAPATPNANPTTTPIPDRPPAPPRPQAPSQPATPPNNRPPRGPSPLADGPRLASPQGRPMPPTPPAGVPKSALPNPRMERFQELRRHRAAQDAGERNSGETPSVTDAVRQWWTDLRPSMQSALRYQHEAKASGTHPIPAYEPTPTSRLGDVFGRLSASARGLTGRAQNAAGPTFKRIHDQVEQAAQGIVDRFEGNPVRQQAPFLGPGRVAIFFRQGVTVGQAQRLLAASNAQPMRLIPRKHGFLARVRPGHEADVCERLRQHPYVRDVVYLEYNEYGEPIEP